MASFETAFRKLRTSLDALGPAPVPVDSMRKGRSIAAELRDFPERADVAGRLRAALWDAPNLIVLPPAIGDQMLVVSGLVGPAVSVHVLQRSLLALGSPVAATDTVTTQMLVWVQQTIMRRGGEGPVVDVLRAGLLQYLAGYATAGKLDAHLPHWLRAANV